MPNIDIRYVNTSGTHKSLFDKNIVCNWACLRESLQKIANKRLYFEPKDFSILVVCTSFAEADSLIDVLERDSSKNEYGRFYIGEWYIPLLYLGIYKVISDSHSLVKMTLNFHADAPIFTKETSAEIRDLPQSVNYGERNYPYNYPYNYARTPVTASAVTNREALPADFIIYISPTENVSDISFSIGSHTYAVGTPVSTGETLTVDTVSKQVYKSSGDATINVFANASEESYIFEKIGTGSFFVTYSGPYDVQLRLFEHRRVPPWTI